ncbi:MAG: hypothetical protein IJ523_03910 [Succinivibrionaceae bacterium]|nr:hypothetical protein [Succinivibrionaceae bacterium]
MEENSQPPLCVDLDGTVVYGDMSLKSFTSFIAKNPFRIFLVGLWHLRGRAFTKYMLSRSFVFDPQKLDYIPETIAFLKEQKAQGRRIYLCTGSCVSVAMKISRHLELFDGVMGTKAKKNFIGQVKCAALVKRFGDAGFDYVGNSSQDLKVWKNSRRIYIVNASSSTVKKCQEMYGSKSITVLDRKK